MNTNRRASELYAEKVLAVLAAAATPERLVSTTQQGMARAAEMSPASASRSIALLLDTGALELIRLGNRSGPSVYRVLREPDRELLAELPLVA